MSDEERPELVFDSVGLGYSRRGSQVYVHYPRRLKDGTLVAGVVYSFPKWYFYLLRQRDQLEERLEGRSPESRRGILESYQQPTWRENKKRITGWMTFWPWSAIWTLINDPIRRFFRFVSERLSGAYQAISDSVFKKYELPARDESGR